MVAKVPFRVKVASVRMLPKDRTSSAQSCCDRRSGCPCNASAVAVYTPNHAAREKLTIPIKRLGNCTHVAHRPYDDARCLLCATARPPLSFGFRVRWLGHAPNQWVENGWNVRLSMRAVHHARRCACANIFDVVPHAPWRCGTALTIFLPCPSTQPIIQLS